MLKNRMDSPETPTTAPAAVHADELERDISAADFRMATFRLARRLRAERAIDSMKDERHRIFYFFGAGLAGARLGSAPWA